MLANDYCAITTGSGQLENHILSAFPKRLDAQFAQVFLALSDGQKVIAGQLPHLAGETARTVRQDNLDRKSVV